MAADKKQQLMLVVTTAGRHGPITVASWFGEPEGKTSSEELIAAAHAASFDRAAREAERDCPVSRALQGSVEIGVQATLDGHPGSSAVGAA